MAALMAHGGWIASPIDLLRFAVSVDKYVGTPSLLTAQSLSAMLANPKVPSCNADGSTSAASAASWYGFGFQVNQYGNYWHTGSLPGTATEDVVANNGFNFAAFFNTRPANSNQFASDLDSALWTAFKGVSAWTSEDFFDEFGTCSAWMTADQYAVALAAAVAAGQFPARVEGKMVGSTAQFCGQFMPLHAGSTFQSGLHLDCVTYQAQAAQAQQAGRSLISLQTFTDPGGLTRFQATWQ